MIQKQKVFNPFENNSQGTEVKEIGSGGRKGIKIFLKTKKTQRR